MIGGKFVKSLHECKIGEAVLVEVAEMKVPADKSSLRVPFEESLHAPYWEFILERMILPDSTLIKVWRRIS